MHRSLAISALLISLASCGPRPFAGDDRDLVARDLGRAPEHDGRFLPRLSPASPLTDDDDPPPEAGAEHYIRRALARSPSLAAQRQRVLGLRERVPQVTAPPDPMLEVTPIGRMDQTVAGEVMVMTGVRQTIPFPGKLASAGRVAEQESLLADQERRRMEAELAGEVRRAYWSLYAAERALELTSAAREALAQIHQATLARYRAGQGQQQDVLRAGVELAEMDQRLVELRADRDAAAALLNTLSDQPPDTPAPVASRAEPASIDLAFDELATLAARSSPRLEALRHEAELARRRRHLAHLQRYPDFTAIVSYNLVNADEMIPNSSGDDQWSIGVGINIPLWQGRLDAAEREATRGVLEAAGRAAAEQNRIAYRLREALARLEAQRTQIALLDETILPRARQALEASRAAYASGVAEFLNVIENWRRLLTLEQMRERLIADTHLSIASILEAVGLPTLSETLP